MISIRIHSEDQAIKIVDLLIEHGYTATLKGMFVETDCPLIVLAGLV